MSSLYLNNSDYIIYKYNNTPLSEACLSTHTANQAKLLSNFVQAFVESGWLIETQPNIVTLGVVFNILRTFRSLLEVLSEVEVAREYGVDGFLVKPFDALSILPESGLRLTPRDLIVTEAVLFASKPHPLIHSVIGPGIHSEAVFLVIPVLSLVPSTVLPRVDAHSLHVVVEPLSLILTAVEPCVCADAADLVFEPLAVISGPVVPRVHPGPMLLPREVQPLIHAPIRPRLLPRPMLQVILPLSLISRPVHVNVDTIAVGFVVDPVAFVDVAVDVNEFAVAMSAVVAPLALVAGTIRPDLDAIAVAEPPDPLALVGRARLEGVKGTVLSLGLRVVLLLRHSLSRFLHCEVLAIRL